MTTEKVEIPANVSEQMEARAFSATHFNQFRLSASQVEFDLVHLRVIHDG